MTPTATYIAEENCLQEISQIEVPKYRVSHWPHGSLQYYNSLKAWGEYNAHLATLRKIPCDPSCKGLWADGQKVLEGVDYEIKGAGDWKWCYQLKGNIFAFPLVPVKSEDEVELWKDMLIEYEGLQRMEENTFEWNIGILREKYTLTPKQ